jgi:hypothetical protein
MSSCECGACTCGCCEGVEVLTPLSTVNRPGLDVIRYRVGTHGAFFESMRARLSSESYPALRRLRTRLTDDFSIAFLDAWATVADVLTFYQERIVVEGFLRTATERRSVLELARLVGYVPRPGLAASVHLAYTLDAGHVTTIPRGSRAQSVPGPGELPQTFETSEDLEARAELSIVRPRLTRPQYVTLGILKTSPSLYLEGIATNLRAGDWLLLRFRESEPGRALFQVDEVTAEPAAGRTLVRVIRRDPAEKALERSEPAAASVTAERIRAVARRYSAAGRFGISPAAAKPGRDVLKGLLADLGPEELTALARETGLPRLKDLYAAAKARRSSRIASWLERAATDLEAALGDPDLSGVADGAFVDKGLPAVTQVVQALSKPASLQPPNAQRVERDPVALYASPSDLIPRLYGVLHPFIPAATYKVLANVAVQERAPLESLDVFRVKAALFGHNLPREVTFDTDGKPHLGLYSSFFSAWSGTLGGLGGPLTTVLLDTVYDQVRIGSTIAIRRPLQESEDRVVGWVFTYHEVTDVQTLTAAAHGVSSRVTVLSIGKDGEEWLRELNAAERETFLGSAQALRATTVFAQNEPLPLAQEPITDDVTGEEDALELDGLYRGLEAGRFVIVEGERTDVLPAALQAPDKRKEEITSGVVDAELAMISSVVHRVAKAPEADQDLPGDVLHTFIHFANGFAFRFKRETVRIHANVVTATHGETKIEVLGSGDATRAFQTFALKQPPLTYIAAPTARGAASTLEVRVNEVLWHEAPHFAGLEPSDRRYTIRTDDDGKTSVVFGNGEHGARLPTGPENVRARYRSGIGKAGNVASGQITLLLSKPLGVKEVVNPIRAAGGADRETRDQARRNAPKGAKSLERLVSVQDYADFAETFAGIGKASAVELSDGRRQLVHVTIAGAEDIPILPTSDLFLNLGRALRDLGDPNEPLELAIRELRLLVISAKVAVRPDFSFELVEPHLRTTMLEAFGFERRALGQDVLQAEVLSVLQGVAGVAYVDLDVLTAIGEEDLASPDLPAKLVLESRVRAKRARPRDQGEPGIAPAQLAILRPDVRDTLIFSELR